MTHQSRQTYVVFVFSFVCAFIFGVLGQAQAQQPPEIKAVKSAPMPNVLTLKDNRLTAKPGFVLGKGKNNQLIIARRAGGGGGLGATADCKCSAQGNCDWTSSGGVAICAQSTNLPCNGSCAWELTPLAGNAGAIAR
jgi:hypothetical protein